jgi:two-component system chemotaxis response regulator CheB
MQTRDIIVIGSSMGGVEALSTLVKQLPADLPASVLVVQHISPESRALLAGILSNKGQLPAVTAVNGMPLERGRIYVAPPDRHLLLTRDGPRVVFGPRENCARPAIDPLFRTAAVNYRSRVIGVILTGLLGDGASGLLAVQMCGGLPIVQALHDAAYPEMPATALDHVGVAQQLALSELGAALVRLTREPAVDSPNVPEALRIEAALTERGMETEDWNQVPGTPTRFTCPECAGALQEIREQGRPRYRCRVGHAYSPDDLVRAKSASLEQTLWLSLQTLEEHAQMLDAMASEQRLRGWSSGADTYESRARETRVNGERLRVLLANLAAK